MFRRIIAIALALMIMVPLCACGTKEKDTTGQASPQEAAPQQAVEEEQQQPVVESAPQQPVEEAPQEAVPQQPVEAAQQENVTAEESGSGQEMTQEDWDRLSAIGDVQVDNGIMTVSLTVPADLAQNITQETIDAGIGTQYQAASRNEDGSITYKMTKAQHQAMLEQLSVSFDNGLQEMINDDGTYTIANITRNDDFTVFDITLDGAEPSMSDSFAAFGLYMYGGMYGVFNGSRPEHVIVNYYDSNGNLIESGDSANAGQQQP